MGAIDIHTHAFPDEIAERAIAALEAEADWKAVSRGTVGELVQSMDAADVDVSAICTIATKPDQPKGILKWCRNVRSDRIEPLPSVHPDTPEAPRWLETFAEEGFIGIKLHPMYQAFAFDEPRMDDIYRAASQCGLIVQSHCGLDVAFGDTDDRAAPERFRRVIDRHPDLKLICTHMGGWRSWDQAEQWLIGANVYLETSFSLDRLEPQRAVEMMRRHGIQRVLFGTDWPWADQARDIQRLRSLPLTAPETRALLFGNAARLIGY